MALTIEGLENLFPELVKVRNATRAVTRRGRKDAAEEIADSVSRLLAQTQSVDIGKVKKTAAASGDRELQEQAETMEELISTGVIMQMEKFLSGNLEAGSTDELIENFEKLDEVVRKVTRSSPIAISKMVRSQVAALRSGKTSMLRKANAVSNFQKVTGSDLGQGSTPEEILRALEEGSLNLEDVIEQMEMAADKQDSQNAADETLTQELSSLINSLDAGLIEQSDLTAAIAELTPVIEESGLNPMLKEQLKSDKADTELLQGILGALTEESDPIKDLNLRESLNGKDKENGFGGLISDRVKDGGRRARGALMGFLGTLLSGAALLALLGATGVLSTIGNVLKEVGSVALNFIKETVAPAVAKLMIQAIQFAFNPDTYRGEENHGNFIEFLLAPLRTAGFELAEQISLAARKFIAIITPGQSASDVRSAFFDAQDEAQRSNRAVVATLASGKTVLLDIDGDVVRQNLSGEEVREALAGGAIDRTFVANTGDFGGVLGRVTQRRLDFNNGLMPNMMSEENQRLTMQEQPAGVTDGLSRLGDAAFETLDQAGQSLRESGANVVNNAVGFAGFLRDKYLGPSPAPTSGGIPSNPTNLGTDALILGGTPGSGLD